MGEIPFKKGFFKIGTFEKRWITFDHSPHHNYHAAPKEVQFDMAQLFRSSEANTRRDDDIW